MEPAKLIGWSNALAAILALLGPGIAPSAGAYDPCLNAFPLAYVSESLRIAESEMRPNDWIWFSDVSHNEVRYIVDAYTAGQAEIRVRTSDCSQQVASSTFAWIAGETNAYIIDHASAVDLPPGEYRIGVHAEPGCAIGFTTTQPGCWAWNPITSPPTGNYRFALLATWRL